MVGHSKNDELRTPDYIYDWLWRRFRLDFDAAASHANHRCPDYATKDGTFVTIRDEWGKLCPGRTAQANDLDGLTVPWRGLRVFVNPPYSRGMIEKFVDKAIAERDNAEIIVMLVKVDTSTEWWRKLSAHAHVEFLGRVRYLDENGGPLRDKNGKATAATFPSCVAIFRPSEPKPR